VWSDRGGKDFINYKTLDLYKRLRKEFNIPMIISTYESKHGKTMSDAHIGTGKRKVWYNLYDTGGSNKLNINFITETFSKLKNTKAFQIGPSENSGETKTEEIEDIDALILERWSACTTCSQKWSNNKIHL